MPRRGTGQCDVEVGETGRQAVDSLQRQAEAHHAKACVVRYRAHSLMGSAETARSASLKKKRTLRCALSSHLNIYGVTVPRGPTMTSQEATPVLHAGTVTVPELFVCDVADVDPSPTTALMISLPRVLFPLQVIPIVM